MPIWHAVLLGVVQGLTEFLPVSSTAHLLLAQHLLGRPDLKADPFTVAIQLGTLFAVFAYFRRDVSNLTRAAGRDLAGGYLYNSATPDGRTVKLIVVGTIPVVVAGLFLKKWLEVHFYNPPAIGAVAIVFAALMALAEWRAKTPAEPEAAISFRTALLIGLFQALALMPGASRSGTTITAGLFCGLARPAAARFSFLLSLPSVLAAGVKSLYDDGGKLSAADAAALAVGVAVSFVVGYASIAWLLRYLAKRSLWAFVAYRVVLGIVLLLWFAGR